MAGSPLYDKDEPIAEINVVPLVDVILVVLIIFMVAAPLVLKPVIDVSLPEASSGQRDKITESVEVIINDAGHVFLDGQEVSLDQLKESIQAQAQKESGTSVILTADKEVTLNNLTAVIDIIKNSGIKKVGFSVQKK